MQRSFAFIAALLCSSCMPVVQHGPWVRDGISAAGGGTGGVAADWTHGGQASPIFSFEAGIRAGITPNDSSSSGVGFGLQLPLLSLLLDVGNDSDDTVLQFVNVDGYVALPGPRQLNLGAGLTASNFHYTPYLQAGRLDDWYATLAVMFANESDVVIVAPSYTKVRRQDTWLVQHVTFTAGMGVSGDERVLMAGVTIMMELHTNNARP